jgi:hypothetical protein
MSRRRESLLHEKSASEFPARHPRRSFIARAWILIGGVFISSGFMAIPSGIAVEKDELDVAVGVAGAWRAGSWTPLAVLPASDGMTLGAADAPIHVWAEDPDGAMVRSPPAVIDPSDRTGVGRVSVRIGRPHGRILIEHARLGLVERMLPEPIPSTREVVLVVGELPAIGRVVRQLRDDGPPPVVVSAWGAGASTGSRAAISAAGAEPRDFDGIDTVVACGRALPATPPEVLAGIDAWVRRGGRLLLCAGVTAAELSAGNWPTADWLPGPVERLVPLRRLAAIESFSRTAGLAMQPDAANLQAPLLANRGVLQAAVEIFEGGSPADFPLAVRRSYGLGTVTWVGLDLDTEPFVGWAGTDTLLVRLLGGRARDRAAPIVDDRGGPSDMAAQLRRAIETLPMVPGGVPTRPVPFAVIIGLGLAYVLCLYPLDWWLTTQATRAASSRWLVWLSLPAIVTLFTGAAWLVAERWRLSAPSGVVRSVDIVDLDLAGNLERGRSWAVAWCPDNMRLAVDLTVAPDFAGGVSWWADAGAGFGGIDSASPHPPLAGGDYRYGQGLGSLVDVPVAAGANRLFEGGWSGAVDLAGVVESRLVRDAQGALEGTVVHHLPFVLEDCRLVHGGWIYDVGTLEPGRMFDPRDSRGPRSLAGAVTRRGTLGERDLARKWDANDNDVARILEVSGLHAAAGGTAYTRLEPGSLGRLDLSPLLAERAILVGLAPVGREAGGGVWSVSAAGIPEAGSRGIPLPVEPAVRLYRIVMPLEDPEPTR